MLKLILTSMHEGVDVSIALLKYMGYKTERTEWNFSDLAPKAQQRIRSMYLVSSYREGFESFQVFHIELYQSRDEQALKTARIMPILDTFLRRYAQGQYLFIFSAGNSHLVLFHLRKTEWQGNVLLMRFVSRYMDISHLHKVDRWLFESLRLSRQEQTPAQIWTKHRYIFSKLRQRRQKLLHKRKLRPPLLETYYNEIYRYRNPSQSLKDKLIERLRGGDETARQDIIQAHLWLVVHEAKKFQNLGLELVDLIQEGNLGLLRAMQDFDPNRGTQFSTYATHWVRQKIRRALADKSLQIRLPVHVQDQKLAKLTLTGQKLFKELGFWPGLRAIVLEAGNFTQEERCEAWCCWVHHIPLSYEFEQRLQQACEKTYKLLMTAQGLLPLNESLPDDLDLPENVRSDKKQPSLADILVADFDMETQAENALLSEYIQEILGQISGREKEIINARFGLVEHEESTLQEVAERMGVTRERIRQLENAALDHLKRLNKNKISLKEYFYTNTKGLNLQECFTGHCIGDFRIEEWKSQEPSQERKFIRILTTPPYDTEIQRWKKLTYPELMNEIRKNIDKLPFDDVMPSLATYIENYRSTEFEYRTEATHWIETSEIDFDLENEEEQDEITEEQE